jgi:hypothetical protein
VPLERSSAGVALKPATVIFQCTDCGLTLSVPHHQAGICGPCPGCGIPIKSPDIKNIPTLPSGKNISAATSAHETVRIRRRGHVSADLVVNQQHLEQRDSAKTLRIIALVILVVCLCLAVTWFLKDWASK